jgi:hypothetical protein
MPQLSSAAPNLSTQTWSAFYTSMSNTCIKLHLKRFNDIENLSIIVSNICTQVHRTIRSKEIFTKFYF